MEIYVSHVRRKQLPAFVFPDGYKRSRQRHVSPLEKKTADDAAGCEPRSAEKKRKNDAEEVGVKFVRPEKRASISPQRLTSVSPESNTSRSGGVRLEGLTTRDVDSISEARSTAGPLEGENCVMGNNGEMVPNAVDESIIMEQASICISDLPEPQNEVKAVELVDKPSFRLDSIDSCVVPYSVKEAHQSVLNVDEVGNLSSVDMVSVETNSSGRLLKWTEGAVDVDRDLVKPCNRTTVMENAEQVFKSSSGSGNLNCKVSLETLV